MDLPRKVQLTGRNTFIVSLPHEWIARHSVKKGDAVYMAQNADGTLSLSVRERAPGQKSCVIDVSSSAHEAAMRNIVSAYVGGASRIVLRGGDRSTLAEEARRVLSGAEITGEEGEELTLRILTFEDLEVDSVMKRGYNVTRAMFGLAVGAYKDGADTFTEISRKEDEVDRLFLLLLRDLCVGDYPGSESVFKAIAAKSIEKVGDHLVDICGRAKELAPDRGAAALLERAQERYEAAYRAFSGGGPDNGDYQEAKTAYLEEAKRFDAAIRGEKKAARVLALRWVAEGCGKIARYSEDMVESAGDMYFAKMEPEARKSG